MTHFIKPDVLQRLREQFPKGCRVELLKMDDPQAPPVGTIGTVLGVDDIGSIMVNWDSGGSLSVAYGEDLCRRVDLKSPNIILDPSDLNSMRKLMDDLADRDTMLAGENENGESITISVWKDRITTVTLQENGWVRENIYHRDGTREELFNGKWR